MAVLDSLNGRTGMTVSGVDLTPLARLAADTLRRHGVCAAGAGWADGQSQALRFEILTRSVELPRERPVTINDLGCGYGALHDYLTHRGFNVAQYYGYDVSDEMLKAARAHVASETARLIKSTRAEAVADFSFLSGPLNYKTADDDAWRAYCQSVIRDLAGHSRSGFAFNMMSTHVTYRVDDLYYADPEEWLAWCRGEFDAEFTLVQDYPLYEWTIGGRHRAAS